MALKQAIYSSTISTWNKVKTKLEDEDKRVNTK